MIRTAARVAVLTLAASALLPLAPAGSVETLKIAVDETFRDTFLSKACGTRVSTRVVGHLTVRDVSAGSTGHLSVLTINAVLTATARGATYTFRDVGADIGRMAPDGSTTIRIAGQVPFAHTGVMVFDGDGEVVFSSAPKTSAELAAACAVLTG